MRGSEQTMRREEQQQKVQQSAKSHQLSASEQTRSCWLLKAALEHWDQRRYERSIDGQRGTLRTEIWTFFIHLRVGRRDRRMEHMLRCGCERYQIYSAMIGCNEINFYGKFIDTARNREQTKPRSKGSAAAHGGRSEDILLAPVQFKSEITHIETPIGDFPFVSDLKIIIHFYCCFEERNFS